MTSATVSNFLHQASLFCKEVLSQPDARLRLRRSLAARPSSNAEPSLSSLQLAAETLDRAILASDSDSRLDLLDRAEELLLSALGGDPHTSAVAFLHLAVVATLRGNPLRSAQFLLDAFASDPSSARGDLAPKVWEESLVQPLFPLHRLFDAEKQAISVSSEFQDRQGSMSALDLSFTSESLAFDEASRRQLQSRMSNETEEGRMLADAFEEALDENTKLLANFLKEFLENSEDKEFTNTKKQQQKKKKIFVPVIQKVRGIRVSGAEKLPEKTGDAGFRNGRYNPISDEEGATDLSSTSITEKPLVSWRRMVPADLKTEVVSTSSDYSSLLMEGLVLSSTHSLTSSDTEDEEEDGMHGDTSFCDRKRGTGEQAETSCSLGLLMDASDHGSTTHQPVLSTDFLCPRTGQVFDDQVTLETGQTYERSAIQEWIGRGRKEICPIKHQKLSATILPKTNCVLKDLNANWREKNAGSAKETKVLVQSKYESPEMGLSGSMKLKHSSSEISVTSQVDGIVPELTSDISKLWLSGSLLEIENSVLAIKRAWGNADADNEIWTSLAKPDVVGRLVEILFNSLDIGVLRTTIYLLSELVARDETVMQTLMQSYPNILEKVVVLLKKGIFEAATLISLLRPSWTSLVAMDLIHSLLAVVKAAVQEGSEQPRMYLRPKTAAILLLMEVLKGDDGNVHKVGGAVIAEKVLENVVSSLESDRTEERIAAIRILLNCIKEKGSCRRIIADKVNLSPVFGIFMSASVAEKFEIVGFLSELVRINRTCSEQLLQKMKDEASFSLMHGLLLYLQTALLDQRPVIAGLLLQLDLLAEPRKMSIYREEAIDVLISCLRDSTSPTAQIAAAEAIIALPGRFSASGKPLTRSLLLKRAGIEKNLRAMMQRDQRCLIESAVVDNLEEEKAVKWEKKMAFALVSHEFGLIFEVLGEGLKNSYKELSARCFVSATWLASILGEIPDTGVRGAARICLLELFISNFKSAQEVEERALAMLAMNSFIHDPDGFQVLTSHMRDILKKLRGLKGVSSSSAEMIKALTGQQEPNAGIWFHKELFQMSCSMNGGVLAINCYRDLIFSGHSDGTIKVWGIEGSRLHLIQETREHSKSVTSLEVLQNNGRLYSGSLDKSIRVWSVGVNRIECVQVHNVKDAVHGLAVANAVACFITQGPGVKVHLWNGISNLVIANKHVRCIRLAHGRLYCGCNDGSIQEVDLATGTSITVQPATRKLIGKTNPIYTLEVGDGFLYSSHASLDGGPAVKMWTTASYTTVGSLVPTADVRSLAITSELIYLGCRTGSIEVWSRENHRIVGTLETRTNSKVLCMSLHANGEVLVLGTADGQIQAWEIS